MAALLLVWAAEAVVFALVVAGILAERPLALAVTGAALVSAGALVRFVPPLRAPLGGAFARHRAAALAGGAVLALLLPLALRASPYWTFVATLALLYITIGQGLNLQIGTAGVLNLAGAAFAGLGGYAVGLLTVSAGWPAWLAVLVAPWVAVVVGAVISHWYNKRTAKSPHANRAERLGTLVASGLIVGEGLWGVLNSGLIVATQN
ncbi:MAG: hypothetical protein AAB387_01635, partial [candidate division NC10 bacterium]